MLNSYMKLAKGKKGIIYSVSRKHSDHICAEFKAEVTKRTKQEYHPRFADKQEYIAFMDSFNKVEEADIE